MHEISLPMYRGYYADPAGRVYRLLGASWSPVALSDGRYTLHSVPPTRACRSITPQQALELSGQARRSRYNARDAAQDCEDPDCQDGEPDAGPEERSAP